MTAPPPPASPTIANILPEKPHMEGEALDFLDRAMREASCYLEYGVGGSTRWALEREVRQIICVESDPKFSRAVTEALRTEYPKTDLEMFDVDIGTTSHWGVPVDKSRAENWPQYSVGVWDHIFENGYRPDLILIDGRFRAACFLASIMCADPGTTILFDDYFDRERHYGLVTQFLEIEKKVGRMAVFKCKSVDMSPLMAFELARNSVRYR